MTKKTERRKVATKPLTRRTQETRARRQARAPELEKKSAAAEVTVSADVLWIPLHLIDVDPAQNTRADSRANEELRESMRVRGQLQPVLVRRTGARFSLVAGYRRYDAAKALQWRRVMARVREGGSDAEVLMDNVAENVAREQLTPAELAEAIMSLHRLKLNDGEIGKQVGLSRQAVGNYRSIMSRVDRQILDRWKQQPGAISVPWLLRRVRESHEEQVKQLEALAGGASASPEGEAGSRKGGAKGKRGPGRDKVVDWLGAARSQSRDTDIADGERLRLEGVVQALEYVVGERPEPFRLEA